MLLEIDFLYKDNIFCDFEYISSILFDINNFTQILLYIERVKKVNIFFPLFVGLCLIKGRRVECVRKCIKKTKIKTCSSCEVNVNFTSRWESLRERSLCFKVMREGGRGWMDGLIDI